MTAANEVLFLLVRILAAMKKVRGDRLTTVFPRQGHYTLDSHNIATYPAAGQLQREGPQSFAKSWRDLMDCIASKNAVFTQIHSNGVKP